MDPLSRGDRSSSVSDLAGLIGGEADDSSDANSSFGAAATPSPPPPPPAAAPSIPAGPIITMGSAAVNEAADIGSGCDISPPRLGHPASVADSLCRSDAGTQEFSVDDEESGEAALLTDCLRRVIRIGGGDIGDDCCVYANCNCRPSSPQQSARPPTAKLSVVGIVSNGSAALVATTGSVGPLGKSSGRVGGGGAGGCKCCCIS